MDTIWPSFDAEGELRDLRARAYGPHPDIQQDPAALARLDELEAAHAVAAHRVQDATGPASVLSSDGEVPSLWQRARMRVGLFAGVAGAVAALVYAVAWVAGPHPDATLHLTGVAADGQVSELVNRTLSLQLDPSMFRGFEPYQGLEPWAAEDAWGNPCLFAIVRSTATVVGAECTPTDGELITDAGVWPYWHYGFGDDLPSGSVIRFQLRADVVDVYVYPAPETD